MLQSSVGSLEPHKLAPSVGVAVFGETPVRTQRSASDEWRILVVEHSADDAAVLVSGLRRYGHHVRHEDTGGKALRAYQGIDLVLLDLDLPDLDGIEVCKEIRSVCDIPIIAVTARNTELDCVLALRAGADDYLVKPCGCQELLARMDAVMRRVRRRTPAPRAITHGRLRVDAATREVCIDGRRVQVTPKEFDLLYHLASRPNTVISRKELMERVWGDTWSRRTVDTHVSSLRAKLGSADWVITVRGVGFRLGYG